MSFYDPERNTPRLDVEAALKVFLADGPLAKILNGYEPREEQSSMMRDILDAYNRNHISLIEAGTGTGKSLAYLIPAMLWAVQTKERTVISTNTITLQEQLLNKDIPLVIKALNLDMKAVLVKGMHNYLCLRKFDELQHELLLLTPQEKEEYQKIDQWKAQTHDGSKSALSFFPSHAIWDRLAAENDTCNRTSCPHYQDCYFFKARKQASEAQILIVNHHLLFADLVYKAENDNFKEGGILPYYNRIILDEAHNIEDIATEYFASHVSQIDFMRLMARITSEKGGKIQGKLPLIKEKLNHFYKNDFSREITSLQNRLAIDLPSIRRDLQLQAHEVFEAFFDFTQTMQLKSSDETSSGEGKLRVLSHHYTHPVWQEKLGPKSKLFATTIQSYSQSLRALIEDLKQLKNPTLDEQIKSILHEINALALRLDGFSTIIRQFNETIPTTNVRWIENQTLKTMVNTTLVDAQLDIAKPLANYLFNKFSTVILCSATLTTDQHFNFIRNRLGLTNQLLQQRQVKEHIYESPFNYSEQALLAIPTDMPNPSDSNFTLVAVEKISEALQSSRGNAFILFTSYTMMKTCYDMLEKKLREQRYHPLKQGDDDRQVILNKFKKTDRSVLFGTDSFWEGVDVVGEALRCVIIVKLPFKVPSDPLIQARSEAITARGGDPFMEYSLPQAIVKFKQGFGRLVRSCNDRGCIICLDNRIMTKRYGKFFLNSLPNCQQAFVPSAQLKQHMDDFYRRTHFLVNQR